MKCKFRQRENGEVYICCGIEDSQPGHVPFVRLITEYWLHGKEGSSRLDSLIRPKFRP
jgi:hypothetical protein